MIYCYHTYYHFYRNDNELNSGNAYHGFHFIDGAIPENQTIAITWNNLKQVCENYSLILPFNYCNTKRGRKIYFYDTFPIKLYKAIKEWKNKETNLTMCITYVEYTPSIQEILKYPNGNIAMKYLIQQKYNITGGNINV